MACRINLSTRTVAVSLKMKRRTSFLLTFENGRYLSKKACPYDNAVAEATYKVMKTEFLNQMEFHSLRHLEIELCDYVNCFNKHRIHGTLSYQTPVQYRQEALKKAGGRNCYLNPPPPITSYKARIRHHELPTTHYAPHTRHHALIWLLTPSLNDTLSSESRSRQQ